jgi:hypothetical protein
MGLCEKHYRRQRATGFTANPRIDNLTRYQVMSSGCWIWLGPVYPNGYGKMSRRIHGTQLAHRAFYAEYRSHPPAGLDLDHLCRVRHCVNPWHLEPVSRSTNLRRGSTARTTCRRRLHDLTDPQNRRATRTGFECLPCWRIRYRTAGQKYRDRLKAERAQVTHPLS